MSILYSDLTMSVFIVSRELDALMTWTEMFIAVVRSEYRILTAPAPESRKPPFNQLPDSCVILNHLNHLTSFLTTL